jgi:nucleoside-diphosphate-sugar epimerase
MRIVVFGGSGFVGRRVVPRLVARGHAVFGTARSPTAARTLEDAGAVPIRGDVGASLSLVDEIKALGADAALITIPFTTGLGPRVVELMEAASVRRGVFVSTTSIFTRLVTASKPMRQAAEDRIRRSALEWTIVRPTMIYGGRDDRNMARLLQLLERSPIIPLPGGGHGLQQPVHVDDLSDALVVMLEDPVAIGKCYEIAGPDALSLREVIEQAAAALGKRARTFSVPLRPVVALAKAYERIVSHPRLRSEQLERLAEDKVFDITDARQDLGFRPRTFREGIAGQATALVGRRR